MSQHAISIAPNAGVKSSPGCRKSCSDAKIFCYRSSIWNGLVFITNCCAKFSINFICDSSLPTCAVDHSPIPSMPSSEMSLTKSQHWPPRYGCTLPTKNVWTSTIFILHTSIIHVRVGYKFSLQFWAAISLLSVCRATKIQLIVLLSRVLVQRLESLSHSSSQSWNG